jgi:hypothetical protein
MSEMTLTNMDTGGSLTLRGPEPGDTSSVAFAQVARPTIGGTFNTSELVGRPEMSGRHFEVMLFGAGTDCAAALMTAVDAAISFMDSSVGYKIQVVFGGVSKTGIILNDTIEFIDMEKYWTFAFDFQYNEVIT